MLLCLPFTDGAFKGRFGKVHLVEPLRSTVVKLLCLQHVTEIECEDIQRCEVSISVRFNDDCIQTSTQLHMCKVTSHFGSTHVGHGICKQCGFHTADFDLPNSLPFLCHFGPEL